MTQKAIGILIITFFTYYNGLSQDLFNSKGFKIGINFSPELGYRTLIIGDTSNIHIDDLKRDRDNWEKPTFLFTTGLFSEYRFNKLLSVKLGVHYTQKGLLSKTLGVGQGFYEGSNDEYIIYKHTYHHIGIPVSASFYLFNSSKVELFASLGGQFDFLFYGSWISRLKLSGEEEKIISQQEKIKKENDAGYNKFFPSVTASIGMDWKIGEKSTLRIEPIYRRTLTPLDNSELITYHYNLGMNISYIYLIK